MCVNHKYIVEYVAAYSRTPTSQPPFATSTMHGRRGVMFLQAKYRISYQIDLFLTGVLFIRNQINHHIRIHWPQRNKICERLMQKIATHHGEHPLSIFFTKRSNYHIHLRSRHIQCGRKKMPKSK